MPENANRIDKRLGIDGIFDVVGAKRLVRLDVTVDQHDADGDARLAWLGDTWRCNSATMMTATGRRQRRSVRRLKAKAKDQRKQNQRSESCENVSKEK